MASYKMSSALVLLIILSFYTVSGSSNAYNTGIRRYQYRATPIKRLSRSRKKRYGAKKTPYYGHDLNNKPYKLSQRINRLKKALAQFNALYMYDNDYHDAYYDYDYNVPEVGDEVLLGTLDEDNKGFSNKPGVIDAIDNKAPKPKVYWVKLKGTLSRILVSEQDMTITKKKKKQRPKTPSISESSTFTFGDGSSQKHNDGHQIVPPQEEAKERKKGPRYPLIVPRYNKHELPPCNEHCLFHATTETAAKSIWCKDKKLTIGKYGAFGRGLYFADSIVAAELKAMFGRQEYGKHPKVKEGNWVIVAKPVHNLKLASFATSLKAYEYIMPDNWQQPADWAYKLEDKSLKRPNLRKAMLIDAKHNGNGIVWNPTEAKNKKYKGEYKLKDWKTTLKHDQQGSYDGIEVKKMTNLLTGAPAYGEIGTIKDSWLAQSDVDLLHGPEIVVYDPDKLDLVDIVGPKSKQALCAQK